MCINDQRSKTRTGKSACATGLRESASYSIFLAATISVSLTRLGRKKKPRCRALHWRQRNGRKSNGTKIVHSNTPRLWERRTSLHPQSGHNRAVTESDSACILGIELTKTPWK